MTDVNLPGDQTQTNPGADNTALNEDVKFEDEELNNLGDENIQNKIKTLSAQKHHWREKAQKALKDLDDLKAKATPAPAPAPQTADVEAMTRKVAMELKRDEALASIPEDKRETVKEFYTSLTTGKTIDASNFGSYLEAAARAAGIDSKVSVSRRIDGSSPGSVPPRAPSAPTREQIELAQKCGQDPNQVYGKDIDLSHMAGAEKFFGNPEN